QPVLGAGVAVDEVLHVHPAADTGAAQLDRRTGRVDDLTVLDAQHARLSLVVVLQDARSEMTGPPPVLPRSSVRARIAKRRRRPAHPARSGACDRGADDVP